MSIKKFDTTQVEPFLLKYKADPTEEALDNLYNVLDSIILTVTTKIASGFSKKNPDDFMDIQQNVRMSIYRILPRLAALSVSGNQVVAVVVKGTVWSFKSHYAAYKRKTPVKGSLGDWMPDNEVAIEVQLETAIGGTERGESSHRTEEEGPSWLHSLTITKTPRVWTNSNQYEIAYLKTLPVQILNKALQKNRFKERETLVRFCLTSLIEGRNASTMLISKKWEESNSGFWLKYAQLLLRLAVLDTIK